MYADNLNNVEVDNYNLSNIVLGYTKKFKQIAISLVLELTIYLSKIIIRRLEFKTPQIGFLSLGQVETSTVLSMYDMNFLNKRGPILFLSELRFSYLI